VSLLIDREPRECEKGCGRARRDEAPGKVCSFLSFSPFLADCFFQLCLIDSQDSEANPLWISRQWTIGEREMMGHRVSLKERGWRRVLEHCVGVTSGLGKSYISSLLCL
jgi:hypothetical protein